MKYQPFGMPGIGGSLGICAFCGENFLTEIILGQKVPTLEIDAIERTIFVHAHCQEKYMSAAVNEAATIDFLLLPDKSPLKIAYLKGRDDSEKL